MLGVKNPPAKPRKKEKENSVTTSRSISKPPKSAELVYDSDDSDAVPQSDATKRKATSGEDTTTSLSSRRKQASSGTEPVLPKPILKRPSRSITVSDSELEDQFVEQGEATRPGSGSTNGNAKAQDRMSLGPIPSADKSPSKRKSHGASASGFETSHSENMADSRSMSAKRQGPKPPAKSTSSTIKPKTPPGQPSKPRTSTVQNLDQDSVSQQGSESSTEADSEGEDASGSETRSKSSEEPITTTSHNTTTTTPSLPYAPPSGFEAATISSHASASHTELFSPKNLEGKQIWHITAPSSVPISSITSVAKQSVQDGSAVLSHQGADYGLVAEAEGQGGDRVLLLPSEEDSRYRTANIGIAKSLNLRQIIRLPSISHNVGAEDAGTEVGGTISVKKPYEKPVPQQPKGLKMRYTPIGCLDDEGPDTELPPRNIQRAPQFRVPGLPASSQSPKKRKHHEVDSMDVDGVGSPKKKSVNGANDNHSSIPVSILSTPIQTPQKPKPARDKATRGDDGSFHSSNKLRPSEKGTNAPTPQKDGKLALTVNGTSSSPTKEPSKKRKKRRTEHDDTTNAHYNQAPPSEHVGHAESPVGSQSSSVPQATHQVHTTNGTASSASKDSSKRKKTRFEEQSIPVPEGTKPTPAPTTNGHTAVKSPVKTDQPLSTPIEPVSSPTKKKRRKHKSLDDADDRDQATPDTKDVTVLAPNANVSQAQTNPVSNAFAPKNPKPLTTNGFPSTAAKTEAQNSSSQPSATNGKEGKLSKKSKIPGETVEERKARRTEKKRRKEGAA